MMRKFVMFLFAVLAIAISTVYWLLVMTWLGAIVGLLGLFFAAAIAKNKGRSFCAWLLFGISLIAAIATRRPPVEVIVKYVAR